MSNLLDRICKLRDILEKKQYDKLKYIRQLEPAIRDEVHRNIARKSEDYNHELVFTSQDLLETAKAISDTLKRWEDIMNPTKQIKKLSKNALLFKEEHKKVINLNNYMDEVLPIMRYRRDYAHSLITFKSLLEYHAVFLYYIEDVSDDNFAINYTERVVK